MATATATPKAKGKRVLTDETKANVEICISELEAYCRNEFVLYSLDEMKKILTDKTGLYFDWDDATYSEKYDKYTSLIVARLWVLAMELDEELSPRIAYQDEVRGKLREAMHRALKDRRPRIPMVLALYCDMSTPDIEASRFWQDWQKKQKQEVRLVAMRRNWPEPWPLMMETQLPRSEPR